MRVAVEYLTGGKPKKPEICFYFSYYICMNLLRPSDIDLTYLQILKLGRRV